MSHKKQYQKQKYTVTIPEQLYNVLTKEAQVLSMTPDNLATARLIECYQNEDLWDVDDDNGHKTK